MANGRHDAEREIRQFEDRRTPLRPDWSGLRYFVRLENEDGVLTTIAVTLTPEMADRIARFLADDPAIPERVLVIDSVTHIAREIGSFKQRRIGEAHL